jgi:ribonuclease D
MNVRRIKGYSDLSYSQQHKLVLLGVTRDKIAQRRNKPSFFILNNDQLLQLAKNKSLNSVLTQRQRLSKNDKSELNDIIDQSYPDTPLENEMIHFTEQPLLKQHLLTWRFAATKKFGLPKRFIISNNEVDGFNESVYSNKVSLLQSLWFASNDSLLCKKLTQDLEGFLNFQ